MTIHFTSLTIAEARTLLDAGKVTARELATESLRLAKELQSTTNAYAEIFDDALTLADKADMMIRDGKASPLTGIPVAIKDNMLYEGHEAASGSKILFGYRSTYSSTVVAKLLSQGAVIIGRTNMDEFAMGSSTESCAYGPVKNPIDTSRIPGGSSGGAAAALVSGTVLGTYGSDTGGSIRQPAALTGCYGLKPTYGRVSRYGLMSLASSFDQIGPFAKSIEDLRVLFHAVKGEDVMDATTASEELARPKRIRDDGAKLSIGVPEEFILLDGIDPDVREQFQNTVEALRSAGHRIVPIKLPSLPRALSVYYIIQPAESSSNLARYDGIRYGYSAIGERLIDVYHKTRKEGFGREVRRRILLGTYVLSAGYYDAYYNKAVAVRAQIRRELEEAFQDVDVIATPTTPKPAWKIGEKITDPLTMYLEDIFTVPANIAGVPGISVPGGEVERDGITLPLGIQFMAAHFDEDALFAAGTAVASIHHAR
jgi:aspartyl-tRNA(Asn)/glutamyl-tRNA(Gln) amidotransferase subunit A